MVANPSMPEEHSNAIESCIMHVTPDQAMEWLSTCAYDGQRPVRWYRVDLLASALNRGDFRPGTISFMQVGHEHFLIDGQHRLLALVRAQLPATFNILREVGRSMDDVAAAYGRIDPIGGGRSLTDVYTAHGLVKKTGMTATQVSQTGRAMKLILTGFSQIQGNSNVRLADTTLRMFDDWYPTARLVFDIITGSRRSLHRSLAKADTLPLLLVIMRYCTAEARPFIEAVAGDDGLQKGTPEKVLVDLLGEGNPKAFPPHVFVRYVASCWNAAYDHRSLTLARSGDPVRPIIIRGTPYNGKAILRWTEDEE